MAKEVLINLAILQASELLTHIVLELYETAESAREVLSQKENFKTLSRYLEKTACILKEFSKQNLDLCDSSALKRALEILAREIKSAKQLVIECRDRNRVYLLVNCRKIVERIERSTTEISRALSLIPLASLGVSSLINAQIIQICNDMLESEYGASVAEEEILEKIELGIREKDSTQYSSNEWLLQIAEALGLSAKHAELRKEYEEFKYEIEEAKLRKEEEESSQMEQIIAVLEKGDATTTSEEKEKRYFERRNSLGSQELGPLQGFICTLTQEVMVDPVETSSGQTFERSAIERWLSEGNEYCPLTNDRLEVSHLRPNRTLRQSIEEWRDRNSIITVASIKTKLSSVDEEEMSQSLRKLHNLCEQSKSYREWVTMEDYMPVLIELLGRKNPEIRKTVLATLLILAQHNEKNKENIIKVEKAIESIVRSLARHARQPVESKTALSLLLELSRDTEARSLIGNVHGCILLLVTMLSSEDDGVSKDAEELVGILSYLEHNVTQMANSNYFKPLLQLLSSGLEDVKTRMAETLAEVELTDHSKVSIVQDGALKPLIQMLLDEDLEKKKVAIKCLMKLSSLPENGILMLKEGAIGPLFEILYCHGLQSPMLREQVAATIMHLCISVNSQESESGDFQILKSEEKVFNFFSLISLTGPDTKQIILEAFIALCHSTSGLEIRKWLRQISAVRVLVQLCEGENESVRASSVKLFSCLAKDKDDRTFLEHVNQKFIETLLKIIKTSQNAEEISAGLGIVANLPDTQQITQWLMDADALPTIHAHLINGNKDSSSHKLKVIDNAVGAICRFTSSKNPEWQTRVAQAGIIELLVWFLSSGTAFAKRNAAVSLKSLSESSGRLTRPVNNRAGGLFSCCGSAPEPSCPAHLGLCGVESSYCLVEANAVEPLARLLGEEDIETREASLEALLTLVDPRRPQDGGGVLDKADAIAGIVKLLGSNCIKLRKTCLKSLEVIFRVEYLKHKYGASAQMPLIDITQTKASDQKEIRSLAARVLCQLGVLGNQSSFF